SNRRSLVRIEASAWVNACLIGRKRQVWCCVSQRIMPKAGLEPARLAAPPPQDGVSANSTTSAKCLLLLRRCWCSRSILLVRRLLGRWLLGRRLLILLLLSRRLLLRLLRLILLLGAFTNDRRAAGP